MSDDATKPIAWMYESTDGRIQITTKQWITCGPGTTETALYRQGTAPRPSARDSHLVDISGKTVNEVERLMIEWSLGAYPTREKQAEALGIGVRTLGLKLRNFHPQMLIRRGRKSIPPT